MSTLAIDIGGTKLAAGLVSDELALLERREMPTPASRTAAALAAALEELVAPLAARAERFAVASTGIIRRGTLTAINPANLGGLAYFPLVDCLSTLTGLPGIALNDAQAAAWAEYQALPEKVGEMLFLTVSTGSVAEWLAAAGCIPEAAAWPGIAAIRWRIPTARAAAAGVPAAWRPSRQGAVLRQPQRAS